MNVAIKNTKIIPVTKAPPTLETFEITSAPRLAKKVTKIIQRIAKIPTTWVALKGPKAQVCVISLPNNKAEKGINTFDEIFINQTIQLESQMKVPINASFSPIVLLSQA